MPQGGLKITRVIRRRETTGRQRDLPIEQSRKAAAGDAALSTSQSPSQRSREVTEKTNGDMRPANRSFTLGLGLFLALHWVEAGLLILGPKFQQCSPVNLKNYENK